MATYCITLDDTSVVFVEGADAYQLEGPLTSFFSTRQGSAVIDSWSQRLASFKTTALLSVQRLAVVGDYGTYAPQSANAQSPVSAAPPAA